MGDGYEPGAVPAGELRNQRRSDESRVLDHFDAGGAGGDRICCGIPRDASFVGLLDIGFSSGDFGRRCVVAGEEERSKDVLKQGSKENRAGIRRKR